eukprot:COSAG01_NODE_2233_length_8112_cov_41.569699_2_plen_256_part_00
MLLPDCQWEVGVLASLALAQSPPRSLLTDTDEARNTALRDTLSGRGRETWRNTADIVSAIDGHPRQAALAKFGAPTSLAQAIPRRDAVGGPLHAAVTWWWELSADYDPCTVVSKLLCNPPGPFAASQALWYLCALDFTSAHWLNSSSPVADTSNNDDASGDDIGDNGADAEDADHGGGSEAWRAVQEVTCHLIGLLIAAGAQRDWRPESPVADGGGLNTCLTMVEQLVRNRAGCEDNTPRATPSPKACSHRRLVC